MVLLSVLCCACLQGQISTQTIDFRDYNVNTLNNATDWVQTVFELPPSRMEGGSAGVTLQFDVNDPGPYNYTYRSELREQNINVPIPGNTTQIYHMQFRVNELPDIYGPITIFQRFNRDNDGPDIEVELTGKNQFSNAIPNDLQVVAFSDGRQRLGKFLKPINDLMVIVYTHANNGAYKVSLNGETLAQGEGLNTSGSTAGTWSQFGLYPHGLHNSGNRQDQKNSGNTQVSFTYLNYSKTEYENRINFADFNTVDLNGGNPGPGPGPFPEPQDTCSGDSPQGWLHQDIGSPTLAGSACQNGTEIKMLVGGDDIWNTEDQFHYVYQSIEGDIEITAKIVSIGNSHFWAKAGIMARSGLFGSSRNVLMCLTHEGRWSFQKRETNGDSTRSTKSDPGNISFPHYVKLVRKGNWFYGYHSPDAQSWALADSLEMNMPSSVYMGLASTSHEENTLNTARIDEISVQEPEPINTSECLLPTGLEGQDLGSVAISGEACLEGEELRISASGADIWDTEDQFHYIYQPLSGNWEISTRVLEIGNSDTWAKAGLMIREGLAPGDKNAFMASTAGSRWSFQYRADSSGITEGILNSTGTFVYPHWLKLVREGSQFLGLYSTDSLNWEIIASTQIEMPDEVFLGIAATSHNNNLLNESRFDQLNFKEIRGNGTFPVTFTDFYGVENRDNGQVDLFWEVALEQGNDYFTIERSSDGTFFEQVGNVPSLGDTRQLRAYTFRDISPNTERNIYRLKQTDIDGQFSYSAQIEVSLSGDLQNSLSVYPTPSQIGEPLKVDVNWHSSEKPLLELRDMLGRKVFSQTLNVREIQAPFELDTTDFQTGLYYLSLLDQTGSEAILSKKVYIQ